MFSVQQEIEVMAGVSIAILPELISQLLGVLVTNGCFLLGCWFHGCWLDEMCLFVDPPRTCGVGRKVTIELQAGAM